MTGPPLLHTIPETARILRCSDVNVYKLIRSGELQAVQFGRRVVVPDSCLQEFIDRHMTMKAAR
jgi:excisionase family DNA binding protein